MLGRTMNVLPLLGKRTTILVLKKPPTGCGRGEVIFDEEVPFLDNHFMVVQVIASEEPDKEPCWTQGILFNVQGRECGFTEPGEKLLGEYRVGDYCVKVEKKDG